MMLMMKQQPSSPADKCVRKHAAATPSNFDLHRIICAIDESLICVLQLPTRLAAMNVDEEIMQCILVNICISLGDILPGKHAHWFNSQTSGG